MNVSGIQGHLLEVTVVGCNKLKDTEWISRQDPYVCVKYGSTNVRTRTCTDGGKNPTFQERFVFTLIEGLREMVVDVWNSNTLTVDDFIGNGKVQLLKVLSQGFDDSAWPLQTKTGRYAGEVRLILHYANATRPATTGPSAPPYVAPQAPMYSAPPASTASAYPPPSSYPPSTASAYPPSTHSAYPPPPASAYSSPSPSPSPYPSYPAYPPSPYPPSAYPPPPPHSAYDAYPPPSAYPPPPYPPSSPYYPPGQYPPGPYPPPY